jgi:hypothetical protein
MKKKVLELFAGSRSIGKVAELLDMEVLSVDKYITENMDLVCGIEDLNKDQILNLLGAPDLIWASPVCTAWSKTSWFSYWDSKAYKKGQFVPKKAFATESVEMVRNTIKIFSWFPNAIFFMENPEGLLMKHPVINDFSKLKCLNEIKRQKVTYCQYGALVRKPTHIWTNSKLWIPRMHCLEGMDCHLSSPKGSQRGIQSLKNNYERSKIPPQLCFEILKLYQDPDRQIKRSIYKKVKESNQTTLFT